MLTESRHTLHLISNELNLIQSQHKEKRKF